jgi:leucyl aminopeptidase
MKIKVEQVSLTEIRCDLLVVNLFEGVKVLGGATGAVDKALGGELTKSIKQGEMEGKLGQVTILHTLGKLPAQRLAVVGLGKKEEFGPDEIRTASAAAIKAAKGIRAERVATIVHGAGIGGLDIRGAAQAAAEGAVLGEYEFEGYKSENPKSEVRNPRINELLIIEKDKGKIRSLSEGAEVGEILARAQNRARGLVNGPANKITPTYLANYARKMAKEVGLKCSVLDPREEGMESIWAVAKGSKEPAKVVVLEAKGQRPKAKGLIALIGKGITFDAGGISIKPSRKLWEMKTDMAGAAAVIEVMRALAQLKIKKNVLAVIPLTENMPDGGAFKPGDVVSSLSKITTEVISTDAEGRMILADAITYAKQKGAKQIIDCATLTGGCVTALGDVASGLMGNDEKLMEAIRKVAEGSGEKLWPLPLYKEYREYLKSAVADQKNCTEGKGASPSTGATFLHKFVGDTPWIHIDIAGTAYLSKGRGYLSEGASGVPVRTLVEFIRSQ